MGQTPKDVPEQEKEKEPGKTWPKNPENAVLRKLRQKRGFEKEILGETKRPFQQAKFQISKRDHIGKELRNVCWIWLSGDCC